MSQMNLVTLRWLTFEQLENAMLAFTPSNFVPKCSHKILVASSCLLAAHCVDNRSDHSKTPITMYPIAASFRSKISRSLISVSSTTAASIVAKSLPKHTAASLSFFATGSSSFTGSSNGEEPQRRPFWSTSPLFEPKVNDAPAVKVVPTIDQTVDLAANAAGVVNAATKTKKPKKEPKAMKAAVPAAEFDLPENEKDFWNTDYLARVLAIKNDLSIAKSKKMIDDIFDLVADVRILHTIPFSQAIYALTVSVVLS
jgi:hypothetical protein